MAGISHPNKAPYPTGAQSTVTVRVGGYVPQGLNPMVVDTFVLPWDCQVISVHRSYTKIGDDLDAITLKTVDSTALTIVAALASPSVDIVGAEQTLHADIVGTDLVKGNKIQMTADSNVGSEEGVIWDTIELRPIRG